MPKWDREFSERLSQRKQEIAGRRESLLEEGWWKFYAEVETCVESGHVSDVRSVIDSAARVARRYMSERLVEQPWFAPNTDDDQEAAVLRNRLQDNFASLEVGDVLPDSPVPIGRVIMAQLIGGFVGLSVFGFLFFPLSMPAELKFLLCFTCGAVVLSAGVIWVNENWRKAEEFLAKWKWLGLGAGGLATLFFTYSWLGPDKLLAAIMSFGRKAADGKTGIAATGPLNVFGGIGRLGRQLVQLLLILILILIMARPKSAFKGKGNSRAKDQFMTAAQQWIDNGIVLAVSLETVGDLQQQIDHGVDKTAVPASAMRRLVSAMKELRDAADLKELEAAREMCLEQIDACGFPVGDIEQHRIGSVIVWEERLTSFFTTYGTIEEGHRVRIVEEPIRRGDGSVEKLGTVRKV